MERIVADVERELTRFDGPGSMPRVVAAWPTAVGDEVARNAWPARVARDGTLHVHTSSSVWACELGQLAPRILERLVAELGDQAPTRLRFAQGHVPEPAQTVSERAPLAAAPACPETLASAALLAAVIGDEELRERVARAAALGLARASDNRLI